MSPETDSAPPPSPPPFEPATSSIRAATGGELKANKRKRIKNSITKRKESQSANGGDEGLDLAELDERDPELASAVRSMVEQEEKDEGELEKRSKTGFKQVCVYIRIN